MLAAPAPSKSYTKRRMYRMVKTQAVADAPTTESWEHEDYLDPLDRTHTQLFYQTNETDATSTLRPSYYREVKRPNDCHDFYWYSAALKTPQQPTSSPSANNLWVIEPMRIEYTRYLRRARLPREFTIEFTPTSTRCTFHRCSDSDGPGDYAGEVVTPFDATCVQRYRWHRKSGSSGGAHWQLVAQNERDRVLVEFRPAGIPNEYEIEFLQPAPSGWSPRVAGRLSRFSGLSGGRSSGFISTPENSDSRASVVLNAQSGMRWRVSDDDHDWEEDTRYWEEFVLATTVVVQDEVNVRPSSHLCMNFLPFC